MNPSTAAWIGQYKPRQRCGSHFAALVQLGERINHAGACPISIPQLARLLGRSERQTQTIVHDLREQGKLKIEEQKTRRGAQLPNLYRLLVDWVVRMIEGESAANQPPEEHDTAAPSTPATPPTPPATPPPLARRVFKNGGCVHEMPACDECRAHG